MTSVFRSVASRSVLIGQGNRPDSSGSIVAHSAWKSKHVGRQSPFLVTDPYAP